MNTEEKARAYDEVLKRAKEQRADYQKEFDKTNKSSQLAEVLRAGICALDMAFPELAESEDEKIRKWIASYIHRGVFNEEEHPMALKAIEYLEKHKEQPISITEVLARAGLKPYKDGNKWCILVGDNIQEGICGFGDTIDEALYQFLLEVLEKQKEPHYTKRNALFDKCVENCDPKTVEEVNKRVDDIMNMPELSAFEQALTNFIGDWEDDEEKWPSNFVKKHGKHILDMAREELQKELDYLNKFTKLPHLNSDYEVVDDWAYTPSLCHCDGNWAVCWIHCEDGDVLHECIGDTPAEAIDKAVEWFTSLNKQIPVKEVGAIISSRDKEETACGYLERCLTPDMRKVWYEACDELKKACFQEAEKQKEQKPVEYLDKDKVYAIMTKLTNLSYSTRIPINSDEYKKINEITTDVRSLLDYPIEQKPAEWDDYTKTNLGRALQIIKKAKGNLQGYQSDDGIYECDKAIECLEHFLYRGLEIEKPAEWSEEDEEIIYSLRSFLIQAEQSGKYGSIQIARIEQCLNWLKSPHPQKLDASKLENFDPVDVLNRIKTEWPMAWEKVVGKQEWSEKDEKILDAIIRDVMTLHNAKNLDELKDKINFLKSLRPQPKRDCKDCAMFLNGECTKPRWKPSEEQMNALNALNCRGDLSYVGQQNQLISLYKDLKKLM